MHRKLQLHPSFSIAVLYYLFTQQFFLYSLLIFSLIVHEFGHLIVARLLKVPLRKLVILPFGGQLHFMPSEDWKYLFIACGGPLFTLILLVIAVMLQWYELVLLQLLLITFNGLPIWPLDGGKILFYTVQNFYKQRIYETFIEFSMYGAILLFCAVVLFRMPLFLIFMCGVLVVETVQHFRFRKYALALRKFY